MNKQKIKFVYADLQNEVAPNTINLDTYGTTSDLKKHNIRLENNIKLWFWRDDAENDPFVFSGNVRFDKKLNHWVADINSRTLKHFSESEFANEYSVREVFGK